MKDLCVEEDDSPEALASIGEILGAAGVNIEGLSLIRCEGRTVVHFVVEDAETARLTLEASGIRISKVSEVVLLQKDEKGVTGRPGSLGKICRMFADNGIAINFGYPAENNRFVFGVDDVAKAGRLLAWPVASVDGTSKDARDEEAER